MVNSCSAAVIGPSPYVAWEERLPRAEAAGRGTEMSGMWSNQILTPHMTSCIWPTSKMSWSATSAERSRLWPITIKPLHTPARATNISKAESETAKLKEKQQKEVEQRNIVSMEGLHRRLVLLSGSDEKRRKNA